MKYRDMSLGDQRSLQIEACKHVGFGEAYLYYDYAKIYDKDGAGNDINKRMQTVAGGPRSASPNSILLVGYVDTGKTTYSALFCKSIFHSWALTKETETPEKLILLFASQVRFLSEIEFIELWRRTFRDGAIEDPNDLKTVPVLFLDDLGTAAESATGYNMEKLQDLIEYRCAHRLRTFITTNFDPEEIYWKDIYRNAPKYQQWWRVFRRIVNSEWMLVVRLRHLFHEPPKKLKMKGN